MKSKHAHKLYQSTLFLLLLCLFALALILLINPSPSRAGGGTFYVNSDQDDADNNLGDCLCATSGGVCTLRAAIQEANACAGPQTIRFTSPMTITPVATGFPTLTDDGTVIDGSDQWTTYGSYEVPGVVLDGNGTNFNGLTISGSGITVLGLEIIRFNRYGIHITGGAQNAFIGGSSAHSANIVSKNGWNGIRIDGSATMSNTITGNCVGTTPACSFNSWDFGSDWGNAWHGISIWDGDYNTVSDNVVGQNGWSGITVDNAGQITITNNYIGVNRSGDRIDNTYYGIHIANGAHHVNITYNQIAYNQRGIYVTGGGSYNYIEHNTIYENNAGEHDGGGILVEGTNTYAGIFYNEILTNTATAGGGISVQDNASSLIFSNTIRANRAYTSTHPCTIGGGGIYLDSDFSTWVSNNQIVSNSVACEIDPNLLEVAKGGGIWSTYSHNFNVGGNTIAYNTVDGDVVNGAGLMAEHSDYLYISYNQITNNRLTCHSSTVHLSNGTGIDIRSRTYTGNGYIYNNLLSGNQAENTSSSAIYIRGSQRIRLDNNLIVANPTMDGVLLDQSSPITIAYHTIANNQNGIALIYSDLALLNSIIALNNGYGVALYSFASLSLNSGNDVWNNSSGNSNDGTSFDYEVNPRFMDPAQGLYSLRPGSPCIDAADPTFPALYDTAYNGIDRPQGSGSDIGAYEMALVNLPLVLRGY